MAARRRAAKSQKKKSIDVLKEVTCTYVTTNTLASTENVDHNYLWDEVPGNKGVKGDAGVALLFCVRYSVTGDTEVSFLCLRFCMHKLP